MALNMADCKPKSGVVLLYPGESLKRQVTAWTETHAGHALVVSFARIPHEIQAVLREAAVALLDGTKNPRLTAAAFSQAADQLGPRSVAVYTEKTCEWLELHVRMRESMSLLGPMGELKWHELFEMMLPSGSRSQSLGPARRWPDGEPNPRVKAGFPRQSLHDVASVGHVSIDYRLGK